MHMHALAVIIAVFPAFIGEATLAIATCMHVACCLCSAISEALVIPVQLA